MAKNSKKKKGIILEEVEVQRLFKEISENEMLTAAEFDSLTEGYECLKQLVVPNMYSEVVMTLITTIISRRKTKPTELVTLDKIMNDTLNNYSIVTETICSELISTEKDKIIKDLLKEEFEEKLGIDIVDTARVGKLKNKLYQADKYDEREIAKDIYLKLKSEDEDEDILKDLKERLICAGVDDELFDDFVSIFLDTLNENYRETVAKKYQKTVKEVDIIYNIVIKAIKEIAVAKYGAEVNENIEQKKIMK